MAHLPNLITDLGLILAVAGITTLIFRKIRQPVVLGYIIAGFLVGPHVSLFPTVVDAQGIKTWSEIGVIFLLFSLGLEFSFRKLLQVGGAASITAVVEIVLMIGLGFLAGHLMGWNCHRLTDTKDHPAQKRSSHRCDSRSPAGIERPE